MLLFSIVPTFLFTSCGVGGTTKLFYINVLVIQACWAGLFESKLRGHPAVLQHPNYISYNIVQPHGVGVTLKLKISSLSLRIRCKKCRKGSPCWSKPLLSSSREFLDAEALPSPTSRSCSVLYVVCSECHVVRRELWNGAEAHQDCRLWTSHCCRPDKLPGSRFPCKHKSLASSRPPGQLVFCPFLLIERLIYSRLQ